MAEDDITTMQQIQSMRSFLPVGEYKKKIESMSEKMPRQDAVFETLGGFGYAVAAGIHYFPNIANAETSRRLLIAALALKRYRPQHGKYPASLNELVPTYLKQIPNDPWDGKPLRYRLKADGDFVLYSVGADGKDDGGDATYSGDGSKTDWVNGRDIVWPRAATPAEVENFMRGQTNGNSTNKVVPK
jgi:hypothetical protein